MDAAAEAAIGRGDDALAADEIGEPEDAVGDEIGVLDDVGRVADDPRQDQPIVGQFDVLPDLPLVLMPDIAGLERIGLGVDRQHQLDDVPHRDVGRVRPMPAAPAQVEPDAVPRQAPESVVESFHLHCREFLVLLDRRLGINHVPLGGERRVVELED